MEKTIQLSRPQMEVIRSNKTITAFIGGTGCGKTFIGSLWSIKMLNEGSGMIVTPSYPMLIRSTLPTFLKNIKDTILNGMYLEQKKIYESKNGNVIYWGSADNPLSLDGPHLDWAWIDEAGLTNITTFDVVLSRIAMKNGRLLITTTPNLIKTRNWIFTELYEKRDQDYLKYIHSISIDNPFYSKEKFDLLKKILDERTFAVRHLAQFIRSSALVYYELLDKIFIDPFVLDDTWDRYVVIDPGVIYGILFIAKKDEKIIVYNEYKTKGDKVYTANEIANIILNIEKNIKLIIHDPARILDAMNLKKELKDMGYDINFYAPEIRDVREGIEKVIELGKTDNLKVFNNLRGLKDEFESYHRPIDETTGQILDEKPVKENDDLLDCLRYGIIFLYKKTIFASAVIAENQKILRGSEGLKNFIDRRKYGQ